MYDLKLLDPHLLGATAEHWKSSLEGDDLPFSPSGYEMFLSHCESILEKPSAHPDVSVYAVVKEGESFASAMFELSYALPRTPNAWIKILSIRTSPRLDGRWEDSRFFKPDERVRRLSAILITGLWEIYRKTDSDLPCRKVKIYANKQVDIHLFTRFMEYIDSNQESYGDDVAFDLETHGNWLVLNKPVR